MPDHVKCREANSCKALLGRDALVKGVVAQLHDQGADRLVVRGAFLGWVVGEASWAWARK